MNKIIGRYKNGNTTVVIFEDGTKIRRTEDDDFLPVFAESNDICITKKCDGGCAFCYEGCTPEGKHGDIMNEKFIDTLHPYTEAALNGNDLSHPDLVPFLKKLKEKKVFANLTVNQIHFERNIDFLHELTDKELIRGLGISLVNPTDKFISEIRKFPNAVIHVINGVFTKNQAEKLADNDLKILILGYKYMRRGVSYMLDNSEQISGNQQWLHDNLSDLVNKFECVCFDNLALKQLDVKNLGLLTDEEWEEFFQGYDGSHTFYIDMVDRKFSKSSTESLERRFDLLDNVDDMFNVIKNFN